MPKKKTTIRVNTMDDHTAGDIAIERRHFSALDAAALNALDDAKEAHREDRHSFFLLETGAVKIEIDFQQFEIKGSSVVYMHPDQVHRVLEFEDMTVSVLAIKNESLNPEYLPLLDSLTPAKPLILEAGTFAVISEAVSLCIKFAERKSDKLYHALLKDSCNALVALIASQYLASTKTPDKLSRFKLIADDFKTALEKSFTTIKSPGSYAQQLNISTPYLNECVKNATGYPVSHQIRQRIILEAKRLLYHSKRSVKEIAADLGYDDYPYFSRLFTKAAGMTPLSFRNKNLE